MVEHEERLARRIRRGLKLEENRNQRLEEENADIRRRLDELTCARASCTSQVRAPMAPEEENYKEEAENEENETSHWHPAGANGGGGRRQPRYGGYQGPQDQFDRDDEERVPVREGRYQGGEHRARSPSRGPLMRMDISEFEVRMEPDEFMDWMHTI